jgi:hypothetical protein
MDLVAVREAFERHLEATLTDDAPRAHDIRKNLNIHTP